VVGERAQDSETGRLIRGGNSERTRKREAAEAVRESVSWTGEGKGGEGREGLVARVTAYCHCSRT